jgi:hypothetical protein
MKSQHRRDIGAAVRAGWRWILHKLENLGAVPARPAELRGPGTSERKYQAPADERTMRCMAEHEQGGMSSAESDARWESGENPGGTHHKAVRREEGEERPRPAHEEPQARTERVPHGEHCLSETRRGS